VLEQLSILFGIMLAIGIGAILYRLYESRKWFSLVHAILAISKMMVKTQPISPLANLLFNLSFILAFMHHALVLISLILL
jgi:hypothetical protein